MAHPQYAAPPGTHEVPYQAQRPQHGERPPRGIGRAIAAWYRLTAPDPQSMDTSLAARELVRRGRVASVILLGLLTIWILYLPVNLASGYGAPALVVFGVGLAILSGLLAMNRRGWVSAVTLCLILPINAGFLAIQLSTVLQASPAERAGSFPILLFSELVAAALLTPGTVFFIAFANCAELALAILLWPDSARAAMFAGSSPSALYNIVVGAPATQFIIALVMFLFTRSALHALARADRAERLAEAQRQGEERQRRELQEGAEHIRHVLVSVSNGNYHVRVGRVAQPVLWEIGASLNTFVGRLDRLEVDSYTLRREADQVQRVAEAILMSRSGRPPIWPAPSGLPADSVVAALMGRPVAPWQSGPIEPVARPPQPGAQGQVGQLGAPPWVRPTWEQLSPAPPGETFWRAADSDGR